MALGILAAGKIRAAAKREKPSKYLGTHPKTHDIRYFGVSLIYPRKPSRYLLSFGD